MGKASRRKRERLHVPVDLAATVERLRAYEAYTERRLPGWRADMDRLRVDLKAKVGWPDWCLVPVSAAAAVCQKHTGGVMPFTRVLGNSASASVLEALYAWSFGREIWRFDADLVEALVDSDIRTSIPVEAFWRLPSWCPYILTPWLKELWGFFSYLEWDTHTGHSELCLVLDIKLPHDETDSPLSSLLLIALFLEDGTTVKDMLLRFLGQRPLLRDQLTEAIIDKIETPLKLLLYLASEAADIRDPDRPDAAPRRRAHPLEPTRGPRVWDVGYRIGTTLRAARLYEHSGATRQGRSPTAHLRRAHWHTYWTGQGSRKDRSKAVPVVRWLHPVLVGSGEVMPVVRSLDVPTIERS